MGRTLLELLDIDLALLTEVVRDNPSLRGVLVGYIAERKLRDVFWPADPAQRRVTKVRKDDDHDRDGKGDLVVSYQGFDFRIEVKSLQTNSVKMRVRDSNDWVAKIRREPLPKVDGAKQKYRYAPDPVYQEIWERHRDTAEYRGLVQCDASDNREVVLPNKRRVKTTNLVVGGFDLLAMGLFAFRERWEFAFRLNRDLPRTTAPKYRAGDREFLLKSLVPIAWPLPDSVTADPFVLLDRLVEEKQRN